MKALIAGGIAALSAVILISIAAMRQPLPHNESPDIASLRTELQDLTNAVQSNLNGLKANGFEILHDANGQELSFQRQALEPTIQARRTDTGGVQLRALLPQRVEAFVLCECVETPTLRTAVALLWRDGAFEGEATELPCQQTTIQLWTRPLPLAMPELMASNVPFDATLRNHRPNEPPLLLRQALPSPLIRPPCKFIDGSHHMWDGDELTIHGCRTLPTRTTHALLIGDSQARTLFQRMVRGRCSTFPYVDYTRTTARKTWCDRTILDPTKRRSERVCNTDFAVFGDGCWTGGAWHDSKLRPLAYAVSGGVEAGWTVQHADPSVVIVATTHHDINRPVNDVLKTLYADRHRALRREFGHTPILYLSPWASEAEKRPLYSLAASSTKIHALWDTLRLATTDENTSHMDVFNMTLAVMKETSDGIHLNAPFPLDAVARLIEHNIAVLTQHIIL